MGRLFWDTRRSPARNPSRRSACGLWSLPVAASLRSAVEIADGQGASWLELRALHSLASRYPDQTVREQLGDLLETIPSGHELPAFRAATGLLNRSG